MPVELREIRLTRGRRLDVYIVYIYIRALWRSPLFFFPLLLLNIVRSVIIVLIARPRRPAAAAAVMERERADFWGVHNPDSFGRALDDNSPRSNPAVAPSLFGQLRAKANSVVRSTSSSRFIEPGNASLPKSCLPHSSSSSPVGSRVC